MATRTRVNGWTCGALAAVALSLGASAAAQPLVDEAGVVRESAYDHLRRALSGEDEVYANIDGSRLKRWLEEIVAFSRRSRDDGNRYWGAHLRHEVRGDGRRLDRAALPPAGDDGHPPGGVRAGPAVVPVGLEPDCRWRRQAARVRVRQSRDGVGVAPRHSRGRGGVGRGWAPGPTSRAVMSPARR